MDGDVLQLISRLANVGLGGALLGIAWLYKPLLIKRFQKNGNGKDIAKEVYKKIADNDLHDIKNDVRDLMKEVGEIKLQVRTNTNDLKWLKKKNGFNGGRS